MNTPRVAAQRVDKKAARRYSGLTSMETAVATKGILVDTWHYAHKAVDRPSAPDGGDGGGASVTER